MCHIVSETEGNSNIKIKPNPAVKELVRKVGLNYFGSLEQKYESIMMCQIEYFMCRKVVMNSQVIRSHFWPSS